MHPAAQQRCQLELGISSYSSQAPTQSLQHPANSQQGWQFTNHNTGSSKPLVGEGETTIPPAREGNGGKW